MFTNKKSTSGTAPLLSAPPSPPHPSVRNAPTAPHTPSQQLAAPVQGENFGTVRQLLYGNKVPKAGTVTPPSEVLSSSPPPSPNRPTNPSSLRASTVGNTIKEKRNINKQIAAEEAEEKLDQEMADMLIVDPTNMTAIEYFTDDDVYRDYCIKMNEYLNDNTEKYLEAKGFLESLLIDLPDISPAVNHLLIKNATKEQAEKLIDRYEYLYLLTKSVKFDYLFYQIMDNYFLQNTNKTKNLRRVLKNIYKGPEKIIFDPVITEFHLSMLLKQPEKVIVD